MMIAPAQTAAGAWVQKRGASYFKLSSNYLSTSREFDHRGQRLAILAEDPGFADASFRDLNATFYAEYGWRQRISLIASLPLKSLRSSRTGLVGGGLLRQREIDQTAGIGDAMLGVRTLLLSEPRLVSLQAAVELPWLYEETPNDDGPPLGTGGLDFEAHLLVGQSLMVVSGYLTAGLGYRRRGGRLNDEILLSAEAGYAPHRRWLIRIAAEVVRNRSTPGDLLGAELVTPLPGGGGAVRDLVVGDQHLFKISPSVLFEVRPGLSVQAEVARAISGANSLSGTNLSCAIILESPN